MKPEDAKKIISTAIDREVDAYAFYHSVAERVKDPALKSLFAELAGEEKKHREFLQNFLSKDVKKFHFEAKKDYKVTDSVPTPPITRT
jgi:rubrerythrin